MGLEILDVDLVLGPGDERLQLAVAEHPQPVQPNHVLQTVPYNRYNNQTVLL